MNSKDNERDIIRERIKHGHNKDEIIFIPARPVENAFDPTKKLRVCAYCRVSTDNLNQTTSYELQKAYYEEMIYKNKSWEFAGIYADEGISATQMKNRDALIRMLSDCRLGKIDMVITKSVSRFSRNVVDTLNITRELKSLKNPVRIFFESENLDTMDSSSELFLSVISTFAQEESQTKSNIMNWSIERRFSKGIPLIQPLLGYDRDKTQKQQLIINEDEAETIKLMYALFISGRSTNEIANWLNVLELRTKPGNLNWTAGSVIQILKNERYCGDVKERKSFTESFITHKVKKNKGERNSYVLQNHHEAIIPRDVWNLTNKIILSKSFRIISKNGIPNLSVVTSGALRGFVPVTRAGLFTMEEYEEACRSAYIDKDGNYIRQIEDNIEITKSDISELNLDGFQSVTSQFFNHRGTPVMSIYKGKFSFNGALTKKLSSTFHVELLFHPIKKLLAVRQTNEIDPYSIKVTIGKDNKIAPINRACSAFTEVLFDSQDWVSDYKYILRGIHCIKKKQEMMLFDLSKPKIFEKMLIRNEENQDIKIEQQLFSKNLVTIYGDDIYKGNLNMQISTMDRLSKWDINLEKTIIKKQTDWDIVAKEIIDEHISKIYERGLEQNERKANNRY
ncbi:MAG: recombinase family protein [Erysipelotrichales bacterium]|nr:recombinase family protein [Erysipelotrichales bacterium]